MRREIIPILVTFIFINSCGILPFKKGERAAEGELLQPESDLSTEVITKKESVQYRGTEKVSDKVTPEDKDAVIRELTFEVKKLEAKLAAIQKELESLQARSQVWENPLSLYDKEIIMTNGSSVFGRVVYQDDEVIKVETLIGYLVLRRSDIVRIVSNTKSQPEEYVIPEEAETSLQSGKVGGYTQPVFIPRAEAERAVKPSKGQANCVLVGSVKERKDKSGNTILYGEVKNIGTRRADFVKINFVFRKDWSGGTDIKTTFVEGSTYTFEKTGITSNNSLQPGETGRFELVLPHDFGPFIGYSYNIEWEYYD